MEMKRVMLVEDEEFILQGIRCIIDWDEISMSVVSMAHNGKEGLEKFREEPVDIVVTDVEMPLMNGLEMLKEIRKISPETRCIILSGYDEFEYARTALKLDVEDYILKPINEEQLRQALINAARHLDEIDRNKAGSMEDKIGWHNLLKGKLSGDAAAELYQMLPEIGAGEKIYGAIMKIDTGSVEGQEGALQYIEDLFINNLRSEVNVDVLYQLALKMAVLLQDIKAEYKLGQSGNFQNLSEMMEKIYQADDIFGLKTIFISEIAEIITWLHREDSHYTPVVKQILEEVQKNYKEDMNLKTLSYKYHMNTSYLGQIFQKEVGCSFNQYLSNTKNKMAKDLILNTNMRINDIAKEVGYPDTSYFYRKFKQCYGVSPASLRNIKKY